MQIIIHQVLKMNRQETEFAQMVEQQKSTIYTVCYMFSKDQDEVSDLFQEVLVNLWKSFPQFEGRSDIRTWVYRVAMNVCVSLDRKKKRHNTVPLTMDINPYDDENPNSKQMELLRKRISLLGPFDRAIIMLWLENMSYDEIAAVVGISVKNVSVRLYRIKEELKKMK